MKRIKKNVDDNLTPAVKNLQDKLSDLLEDKMIKNSLDNFQTCNICKILPFSDETLVIPGKTPDLVYVKDAQGNR